MVTKDLHENLNKTQNNDFQLEVLTRNFIIGKLPLEEYRRKVKALELDTRLDLRNVTSKLKPILIPVYHPK